MPNQLNDPDLLRHQAYINGQWRDAENGDTLPVINPATGEELGSVPRCPAADARAAARRQAKIDAAVAERLQDLEPGIREEVTRQVDGEGTEA